MSLQTIIKFGLVSVLAFALPSLRAADATLKNSTGSVKVTVKGETKEISAGAVIPQGATVTTGPGAEAHIEVLPGAVATLKANTTVEVGTGKETVNLKSGNLVSTIDPAKKVAYTVRTPKGVAAARGTAFSLSVTVNGFSIATTASSVTFTPQSGASFSISAGMVSITPPGSNTPSAPVSLAQAIASNPEIAAVVQTAVQTIATVVQNNIGNMSAESTTAIASQVVAAAAAATPAQASNYAAQVTTAMTATTSATAGNANTAANAVAAVTAAAVTAAPQEAAQITVAVVQSAPQQAAAATAAATIAAPSSAQATVQAVANATGQSTTTVQSNANAAAPSVQQTITNTQTQVQQTLTTTQTPTAPSNPPTQQTQTQTPSQNTTTPPVDPGIKPTSPAN